MKIEVIASDGFGENILTVTTFKNKKKKRIHLATRHWEEAIETGVELSKGKALELICALSKAILKLS